VIFFVDALYKSTFTYLLTYIHAEKKKSILHFNSYWNLHLHSKPHRLTDKLKPAFDMWILISSVTSLISNLNHKQINTVYIVVNMLKFLMLWLTVSWASHAKLGWRVFAQLIQLRNQVRLHYIYDITQQTMKVSSIDLIQYSHSTHTKQYDTRENLYDPKRSRVMPPTCLRIYARTQMNLTFDLMTPKFDCFMPFSHRPFVLTGIKISV